MSILELIVALGILAGLLVVVAASVQPLHQDKPDAVQQLAEFVRKERAAAILSGEALVLHLGSSKARAGASELQWDGQAEGLALAGEKSVVLYPDGSISGALPEALMVTK
jgi:hypothetical protein